MPVIQKAVVDSSPLFSILLIKYSLKLEARAADALIARSRLPEYLRLRNSRRASMIQLFDGIGTILTSSHVIGELQGLQRLKADYHRDFWLFAMAWLTSKQLDERLVRLLDLNANRWSQGAICRIGPTDTGLLDIARQEGAILLTDDRDTLATMGWEQGIDCRLVEQLL